MKKICYLLILSLILFSVVGCQQNDTTTGQNNVCAFVKKIKDNTVVVDIAEYITAENSERISELKLTESDMPNGYYIYNIDTETEEYLLTENTRYNFIDWENIFVEEGADRNYSTTNKEDFIKYINSYDNSQPGMPFFFELSDNEVISIIEKPMM